MSEQTIDERIAARKAEEERLRAQLGNLYLDGPHRFPGGSAFDPFSAMFGGARDKYAICLRCGAVVMLNDPEETSAGATVERSVRIHLAWHEEASA